jgi:hypothetical protein
MFGTAVFVIGEDGKLLSALQFWWGSLESQHRIDGGVAGRQRAGLLPRARGGSPLVHSVNGFRPDETAVYFESQTQFGDIPWPRDGSAGVFLDSA